MLSTNYSFNAQTIHRNEFVLHVCLIFLLHSDKTAIFFIIILSKDDPFSTFSAFICSPMNALNCRLSLMIRFQSVCERTTSYYWYIQKPFKNAGTICVFFFETKSMLKKHPTAKSIEKNRIQPNKGNLMYIHYFQWNSTEKPLHVTSYKNGTLFCHK